MKTELASIALVLALVQGSSPRKPDTRWSDYAGKIEARGYRVRSAGLELGRTLKG